jgi:hypothetical protein
MRRWLSSDSSDSEIGCLPRRVRLQLARNGHALKSQRGLRPVAGKAQELLSLLFGPSPIGPSKAISCVCVIFIDSGHGASLPFSGSTTGLSAIDICRAGPWSDDGSTMRLFAFYSEKKAKCLLLADQLPQIEK